MFATLKRAGTPNVAHRRYGRIVLVVAGVRSKFVRSAVLALVGAMGFVVSGCSDASDEVEIAGLVGPDGATMAIERTRDMPSVLAKCVGGAARITREFFQTRCVIPYVNGLWTDPGGLLRPPRRTRRRGP